MRGLFVTGTDTGVGKTVLAAAIVARLRGEGRRVAAAKPVVTGTDDPAPDDWPHDHVLLARAAGTEPDSVTARRFGPAVSPHLAAELAGVSLELRELETHVRTAAHDAELVVVEGVGGLLAPLSGEHSVRDLARALSLPVLVAARPGLGTINHTLLTLEAARTAGLRVAGVVMTPWEDDPGRIAVSNRETVARLGQVEVAVLARVAGGEVGALARAAAGLPLAEWLAE